MKWKFFIGAAIVVGSALGKAGAPWIALVLGIVLAALLNLRHQTRLARAKAGATGLPRI